MEQEEQQEMGAQEVIIELLSELVQQGREARAGAVMAPPAAEAPPPEAADAEMAELEAMLGEPAQDGGQEMPPEMTEEMPAEEPCPKCGKSPCEC